MSYIILKTACEVGSSTLCVERIGFYSEGGQGVGAVMVYTTAKTYGPLLSWVKTEIHVFRFDWFYALSLACYPFCFVFDFRLLTDIVWCILHKRQQSTIPPGSSRFCFSYIWG